MQELDQGTSVSRTYLNNPPGEATPSTTLSANRNQREQSGSVDKSVGFYGRTKSSPSIFLRGGGVGGSGGGGGIDTADFPQGGPDQRTEPGTMATPTVDNRADSREYDHYAHRAGLVHAASSRDVRFSEREVTLGGSREPLRGDRRRTFAEPTTRIEEGSGLGLEHGGYPRDWAASNDRVSETRAGSGDSRGGALEDNAGIVPANHTLEPNGSGIGGADAVEWWRRGNRWDEASGVAVGRAAEQRQNKAYPAEDHERLGSLYSMIARR